MTDFNLLPEFDASGRLDPHAAKNIGRMVARYGLGPAGSHCRECRHFERRSMQNVWFKCRLSGPTSSAATDWRGKWAACGAFLDRGETA